MSIRWFWLAAVLILCSVAVSAIPMSGDQLDCAIRPTACISGETPLLYLYNMSANYSNSHAQLINYTGTKYPAVLCCNSTTNPIGNSSTGTPFLYLSKTTNSHVQSPDRSFGMNYSYPVFISSTAMPQPYCVLSAGSCPTNYTCLISLHNETNTHVAGCVGGYSQKLCCINAKTEHWLPLPDSRIANTQSADPTAHVHISNISSYVTNNIVTPTITAVSLTSPFICYVSGNAVYVQNPTGASGTGTCQVTSTEPGYPISTTTFTMIWDAYITSGGGGGSGGTTPPITPPVTPVVPPTTQPTTPGLQSVLTPNFGAIDIGGLIKMVAIAVVLFLIFVAGNLFIVWDERKRKNRLYVTDDEHNIKGGGINRII